METDTVTNSQIFELLKRTNQDVQDIKQEMANYREEIEMLKESVETLEQENEELKEKLTFQEELLKKKNILVFKIAESDNESLEQIVFDLLNKKLGINKTINDIDNFYRLGEKRAGETRPILIKFTRELIVREVFKHVHKLKDTGISIAIDLTPEKRADQKILYEFYRTALAKQFSAKIKGNKLFVNKEEYTVNILKTLDKRTFLEPIVDKQTLFRNTSAPSTPTLDKNPNFSDNEEEQKQENVKENNIKEDKLEKPEVRETRQKNRTIRNPTIITQTPKTKNTRSGSTSSNSNQQQQLKKANCSQKR